MPTQMGNKYIETLGRNGWFKLKSISVTCTQEDVAWVSALPQSKAGRSHTLFEADGIDARKSLGNAFIMLGNAMKHNKSIDIDLFPEVEHGKGAK
jgi:hypothetical protein